MDVYMIVLIVYLCMHLAYYNNAFSAILMIIYKLGMNQSLKRTIGNHMTIECSWK